MLKVPDQALVTNHFTELTASIHVQAIKLPEQIQSKTHVSLAHPETGKAEHMSCQTLLCIANTKFRSEHHAVHVL